MNISSNKKHFLSYTHITYRGRSITVRTVTRLRAGRSKFRIPARARNFSLLRNCPGRLSDPLSFIFNGYQGLYRGVKRTMNEVNHVPPSSTEVKNEWCCTSSPPACLNGVDNGKVLHKGYSNCINCKSSFIEGRNYEHATQQSNFQN